MHQVSGESIERDGAGLWLERRGAGERHLLFAHGWISSRRMWDAAIAKLDLRRYTIYRFDARGCGRSDRPTDGHSLEGYAADYEAILAHIGVPVTVIAHSMGGRIAQYLAARAHPLIERMLLVAPGSARGSHGNQRHRDLALEAFGSRKRIARFVAGAMRRPIDEATREVLIDDALIASREHWFGWYDAGRALDFRDELGAIAVPTLVLAGASDPLASLPRLRTDVADRIAGSLFVVLRDCGHNVPIEAPAELAGAIDRFVP
ncbi:MAG: alpha/beta fold hydrolase [Candidatus Eremiobacteraeota bacterium]|nr:alpha/beta fold hydrolase [Candidatus Eremiobacteraeota bacterium]